jgi:hypothetical protein
VAAQQRERELADTRSRLESRVHDLEARLDAGDRALEETRTRLAAVERSKGWRLLRFLRIVS